MIGLWPLNFILYNDWWESTHPAKSFPKYIAMARIERDIVEGYRASMFKDCTASAYIWMGLASALAEACKAKAWDVPNTHTGKMEKKTIRCFIYINKIPCNGLSISTAPKVNIVDLKQS